MLRGKPWTIQALKAQKTFSTPLVAREQHSSASSSNYKAAQQAQRDFILSILEANPSARDSRVFLQNFGSPASGPGFAKLVNTRLLKREQQRKGKERAIETPQATVSRLNRAAARRTELVETLLNPVQRHTALVKIQGPFTDRQLESIVDGMIFLRKLGLVSMIVLDSEEWTPAQPDQERRQSMYEQTLRVADLFEQRDARVRPFFEAIVTTTAEGLVEADTLLSLRAAVSHGEMPIIPPFVLDADLRTRCASADDVMVALARSLAQEGHREWVVTSTDPDPPVVSEAVPEASSSTALIENLTPLRIMIINREGGIPSYARKGNPHLSVNLESEYEFIRDTFQWHDTHTTAMANLELTKNCLAELPRDSSALIVSHRSPRSLVANLITNKPAFSPSLHHSLLPAKNIEHTPTIVRKGLSIRVIRKMTQSDEESLTHLLEASFGRRLASDAYFSRLRKQLDFVIVAGDWEAAAVVTSEQGICYLDKFAVLPTLQGDGTVDFLWGALRDETSGLGLLDALNNNGGAEGIGQGRDLVWRSRADNPVNRWYFERSSGFVKLSSMGKGGGAAHMFWLDAEERLERLKREGDGALVADEEAGRLAQWARVVGGIPSCWAF